MNSHTILNSLPRTKVGRAIRRSPNTRRGRVMTRPKKDRGVISPYPTVVIAATEHVNRRCRYRRLRYSLTRTNLHGRHLVSATWQILTPDDTHHAAAGMD